MLARQSVNWCDPGRGLKSCRRRKKERRKVVPHLECQLLTLSTMHLVGSLRSPLTRDYCVTLGYKLPLVYRVHFLLKSTLSM